MAPDNEPTDQPDPAPAVEADNIETVNVGEQAGAPAPKPDPGPQEGTQTST